MDFLDKHTGLIICEALEALVTEINSVFPFLSASLMCES